MLFKKRFLSLFFFCSRWCYSRQNMVSLSVIWNTVIILLLLAKKNGHTILYSSTCVPSCFQSALVAVGDTQVWAGSHGIFIIDTETMSHRTLVDHPDLVVDIILTHQGRWDKLGAVCVSYSHILTCNNGSWKQEKKKKCWN